MSQLEAKNPKALASRYLEKTAERDLRLVRETIWEREILKKEGKMEGLMFDCKNWGSGRCHSDISKYYVKELKEGENTPEWPQEEEQKRLDEICKTCEFLELQTK